MLAQSNVRSAPARGKKQPTALAKQKKLPFIHLHRLLLSYGYNGETLSPVLECSPPTALKKMKNPEKLTLDDLLRINRAGSVPWNEIIESISK